MRPRSGGSGARCQRPSAASSIGCRTPTGRREGGWSCGRTPTRSLSRHSGARSRNADALAGMSEASAGARREMEARGIVQGNRRPRAGQRAGADRVIAAARVGGHLRGGGRPGERGRPAGAGRSARRRAAGVDRRRRGRRGAARSAARIVSGALSRPSGRGILPGVGAVPGWTNREGARRGAARRRRPSGSRARAESGRGGVRDAGPARLHRAAFEASLRANLRDASTYVNVGQFSLQVRNPRDAADYFAEALTSSRTCRRLAPASRRRAPRSTRIHADVFPSKDP